MLKSKIESLLGFALRSGKVVFGADNVLEYRKRLHIIFLDGTLSDRSHERVLKYAQEKNIPIILSKKLQIEELVNKVNCKVVAITDKQMAAAILGYTNENFEQIVVEVK